MTTRAPYSAREPRTDKGKWHPGSLRSRLMAFFEANPDEELTELQVAEKFAVSSHTVKEAVYGLMRANLLEKVKVVRLPSKGRAS